MEDDPPIQTSAKEIQQVPFPENASVIDVAPKPSVWREFWIGCHNQFWKWYGLEDVGRDITTHGAAVKKGAALRFLGVVILVTGITVFEMRGCVDDGTIQELNGSVTQLNTQVTNLNSDKNALQTRLTNDENALGPLRQIANEKFAEAPPDKRVDLLLQKMESLQSDVDSSLQAVVPRSITDIHIRQFIDALKNCPKGPVAVFVISNSAEVTNFANQIRSMLDDAGYSDPNHKAITPSIASVQMSNAQGTSLVILPTDTNLPFAGPVQTALTAIGIAAPGIVDTNKAMGLKSGEIGIVVEQR